MNIGLKGERMEMFKGVKIMPDGEFWRSETTEHSLTPLSLALL
jgi:hypothetical protein